MLNRLIFSINIPFDPRDENSNQEIIVSALINLGILAMALYLVSGIIQRRELLSLPMVLVIVMILFMIIFRIFVRKGNIKLVSVTLIVTAWVFVNIVFIFFENGLRAPAYIASITFLIVYVGLLHGWRSVIFITTFSIFISLIVGILESQGVFFTQSKTPNVYWTIIAEIIFLPLVAYMVTVTLRNLKRTIFLYREESNRRQRTETKVMNLNEELEIAYETTLEGWAQAIELRDKETEGHSRRVTELSVKLGKRLGFDEEGLRNIRYGALLHDIGKMGIPDEILNKPGSLTNEERQIVNQHTVYAFNLLKDIQYLQSAIVIPYSHHENWDGTGYPQGLKGEEIPLPARIFAVVDNWDALTTDRPYRKAWTQKETFDYLRNERGKKFDPRIVNPFLDILVTSSLVEG